MTQSPRRTTMSLQSGQGTLPREKAAMIIALRRARLLGSLVLLIGAPAAMGVTPQASDPTPPLTWVQTSWPTYGHGPHHDGDSPFMSKPLRRIKWQTPVDLDPQYSGSELLIHYGSPLVTPGNNVIVTVKVKAHGTFIIETRRGSDGALLWTVPTDFVLPRAQWTPPCGPTLTPSRNLVIPAIGGTVLVGSDPDSLPHQVLRRCFYGLANYNATPNVYAANIRINTPLLCDDAGNVYFGFLALGNTPLGLKSGIARMGADGVDTWTSAEQAARDPNVDQVVDNCTPAISRDGSVLYIAVREGNDAGYLLALDSGTLAPRHIARLLDPVSLAHATLDDAGTATPCVGPDGDVYYGVLENPWASNHARGWLLHFDGTLTVTKTPGDFGWDDTPSIVPAGLVPSYTGTSTYLLATKYNNYAIGGGDGVNKIAVLDPNAQQVDPQTNAVVMKEVITIKGVTPDPPNGPKAVKEWCINDMAVDPQTRSALAGSEDGTLYRWDFKTNTLSEKMVLTSGLGEAYTPTVIGVDGTVYAINNAILFAVGE